jgi:hypothetical protein
MTSNQAAVIMQADDGSPDYSVMVLQGARVRVVAQST